MQILSLWIAKIFRTNCSDKTKLTHLLQDLDDPVRLGGLGDGGDVKDDPLRHDEAALLSLDVVLGDAGEDVIFFLIPELVLYRESWHGSTLICVFHMSNEVVYFDLVSK